MSSLNDCMYNWFANAVGVITKVFINLEPIAPAYYSLSTPWVTSGDFEIEVDFATTASSGIMLIGDNFNTNYYFRTNSDGQFVAYSSGVLKTFLTANYQDGKLHNVKFILTGTSLVCVLDGVATAGQTIVPFIGANNFKVGTNSVLNRYFDGILSNVKLTDITTPANSLSFGLDELTGDIEYPAENVFGSELGNTSALNLSGFGTQGIVTSLVIGKAYTVEIAADSGATGTVGFIYNGTYDSSKNLVAGQSKEFVFTATSATFNAQGRGDFVGDLVASVKRIIEVAP